MGDEDTECPTCGRDDFASQTGVKVHHKQVHGESIAGVLLTCNICGDDYRVPPCRADESVCCSPECREEWKSENYTGKQHHNWKGGEVLLTCENCEKTYSQEKNKKEKSRFCSRECYYEWMRSEEWGGKDHPRYTAESLVCDYCSEEYVRQQHTVDESRFCSDICRGKWQSENLTGGDHWNWKGGGPWEYGPNWNEQSCKARRRDQYRCQICGITEPEYLVEHGRQLDVHHITPIREFRDGGDLDHEAANSLENLITLCRSCHSEWEQVAPLRPDTVQPASD